MTQPIQDPTDPSRWIIGDVTEPDWGQHAGAGVIVGVHSQLLCKGRSCIMHNPSRHHMRDWPLTWRDDKGVFERACPHGVGHPDPDDADHLDATGREYLTIHGCDLCCRTPLGALGPHE